VVSKETLGFIMSENLGTRWAEKDFETLVKHSSVAVAQGDKEKAFET
jgi:hypothetical protein